MLIVMLFLGYKAIIQLEDFGTRTSEEDKNKYRVYYALFSNKIQPLRWAGRKGYTVHPGEGTFVVWCK